MSQVYALGVDETAQRTIRNIPTIYISVSAKSGNDLKKPHKTSKGGLRKQMKDADDEADFALGKVNGRRAFVMPVLGLRERLGAHYSQNMANVVGVGEMVIAYQETVPSLDLVLIDGYLHRKTRKAIKEAVGTDKIDLRGLINGDRERYVIALADLLGYSIFRYLHRLRKQKGGKFKAEEYFVDALRDSPFQHLLIEPNWERYSRVLGI